MVYADATGARMQTSGTTDVAILREFLRTGEYGDVEFKIPKSNPAVRERVMLMNAKLGIGGGGADVGGGCAMPGVDQGFRAGDVTRKAALVIEKDRDSKRTHLSDALGYLVWQECGGMETVGERGNGLFDRGRGEKEQYV